MEDYTEFEKVVKSVANLYWTDGISERTIKEKAKQLLEMVQKDSQSSNPVNNQKMTFEIHRTSHKEVDYPGVEKIEGSVYHTKYSIQIDSLDDLKKIEEYYGEKLIVSLRFMTIEIYDTYRE